MELGRKADQGQLRLVRQPRIHFQLSDDAEVIIRAIPLGRNAPHCVSHPNLDSRVLCLIHRPGF